MTITSAGARCSRTSARSSAPPCARGRRASGRRQAFALAYAMALGAVWFTFGLLDRGADVYWMLPLLGFCTCGIFGVIIVYLPELYPDPAPHHGHRLLLQHRAVHHRDRPARPGQADRRLRHPRLRHADPPRGHEPRPDLPPRPGRRPVRPETGASRCRSEAGRPRNCKRTRTNDL